MSGPDDRIRDVDAGGFEENAKAGADGGEPFFQELDFLEGFSSGDGKDRIVEALQDEVQPGGVQRVLVMSEPLRKGRILHAADRVVHEGLRRVAIPAGELAVLETDEDLTFAHVGAFALQGGEDFDHVG